MSTSTYVKGLAAPLMLGVLYPDLQAGCPPPYVRDGVPAAQFTASPTGPQPHVPLGFTPGELIGCVSGELGLRDYLGSNGHGFTMFAHGRLGRRDARVWRSLEEPRASSV
ncbi:hypothetical protein [Streptomyces sp. NPDC046805]|uniref:hypothetical protein n=1 Tax=Streptomyces sp. NPDC046805 TaxID=3155134 RepID=UPI0034066B26